MNITTMKHLFLLLVSLLSSCTCSITMVHTEGQASDVVDEQQTPSTTVSPNLTVPIKPL
jgi:hypothetical protein